MKGDTKVRAELRQRISGSTIPFVERPTCTIAEACSAVGFGKTKLYELLDGGAVESVTIGRRRLIRVPSLLRLLGPT